MKYKVTETIVAGMFLAGCTVSPEGLNIDEVIQFTSVNVDNVVGNQEPVTGPVGLYEAMARALKYNLDFKVEMKNEGLVARKFDLTKYDMMPSLVAYSGYAGRDNYSGGRSRLINLPKTTSLALSASLEKNVVSAVSQLMKITDEFLDDQKVSVLPGMNGTATFLYSGS